MEQIVWLSFTPAQIWIWSMKPSYTLVELSLVSYTWSLSLAAVVGELLSGNGACVSVLRSVC